MSLNSQQFNTFEKYEHLAEFLSSLQKLNAKSQDNKEMEDLKSKLQSQEIEIEKLRASLKVFEGSKSGQNLMSIRDIFIVQKSRIASLEKEIKAQITDRDVVIKFDDRDTYKPGWKFAEYELKNKLF